jgi:hypothetical protein
MCFLNLCVIAIWKNILMMNASLTESGEYLLAVIKKWLKDNVMEVQWEAERTRLWTPWTK